MHEVGYDCHVRGENVFAAAFGRYNEMMYMPRCFELRARKSKSYNVGFGRDRDASVKLSSFDVGN